MNILLVQFKWPTQKRAQRATRTPFVTEENKGVIHGVSTAQTSSSTTTTTTTVTKTTTSTTTSTTAPVTVDESLPVDIRLSLYQERERIYDTPCPPCTIGLAFSGECALYIDIEFFFFFMEMPEFSFQVLKKRFLSVKKIISFFFDILILS